MKAAFPQSSVNRRAVRRWVVAAITVVLILAVFGALTLYRPMPRTIDRSSLAGSSVPHEVSQTQLTAYCPARMSLSDTGSYGDTQYQASEGNIASSARYAAFGSVYKATIDTLSGDGTQSTELENPDLLDSSSIKASSGNVDKGPTLVETKMLQAQRGTGTVSSVAAWATKGDLRGLSASSCITPALTQSFLLPAADGGSTNQLVIANTSAKATTVNVTLWGTKTAGILTSATGSSLSVAAHAQSMLDLGAAAPGQKGLLVTISSSETPVAAVVRSVRVDGLTDKGSDYAQPLASASRHVVVPSVNEGDTVTILMFSAVSATATVSWIGADGSGESQRHDLVGGKVSVIDLGKAPRGVSGISVDATHPIRAEVRVADGGTSGQEDFALIGRGVSTDQSAVVVPDDITGTTTVINTTDNAGHATIQAYDGKGKHVGTREVSLAAHGSTRITDADISSDARLFMMTHGDGIIWGVRLSRDDVSKAGLAGVAYLASQSLDIHSERVWAKPDQGIVK